ncbi:MAG: dockerin type I repeat-containing protein [Oscillospiraceae bacterium]
MGLWFPKYWAGTPDFDTAEFEIDYIKITPFHESGDKPQNESYPDSGWAEISEIAGDVNAAGNFNIADVILFQKWLLNVPDTHLENWKAADFYEDDRLNIFDLCLMKRELLNPREEMR